MPKPNRQARVLVGLVDQSRVNKTMTLNFAHGLQYPFVLQAFEYPRPRRCKSAREPGQIEWRLAQPEHAAADLKILKEAGLVSDQRNGARRLYRLDRAGLAAMRAWLEPFWEEVTAAFNEEWERQLHDRMNT